MKGESEDAGASNITCELCATVVVVIIGLCRGSGIGDCFNRECDLRIADFLYVGYAVCNIRDTSCYI